MTCWNQVYQEQGVQKSSQYERYGAQEEGRETLPQQDTWVHNLVLTPQEEPFIPTEVESKDTGEGLDEA